MLRLLIGIFSAFAFVLPATAQVQPFPTSFHTQEVHTNGTQPLRPCRRPWAGGRLLHGYGETGDMWAPLAVRLASTTP